MTQPGRQDLLELGQRADRRLLDPGHAAGRGRAQSDRDCHRLLVVQQQRRQRGSGPEPIAGHPWYGVDRVAEVAQLLDVPADRADPDAELRGERGAAPVSRRLQERQQFEQSRGGFQHDFDSVHLARTEAVLTG